MNSLDFETYDREDAELYRPFFNAIVGTFTFTCDMFFLATILKRPPLRARKEYMVLGANILLDALFGAAYVDKGIHAIVRYYSGETVFAKIHPSECLKRPNAFVYAFVQPGAGMIMLFTALDRLYSVMRPIRYLQRGMLYAAALMTGAYLSSMPTFLYTVINAIYGFNEHFVVSATCNVHSGWMGGTMDVVRIQRCISTVIGAFLYIPISYQIIKIHKVRTLLGIVTAADRRRLVKVTCTILLIAGSHLTLLLIPDVLLTFILVDPAKLVHNGLLILTASQGAVNVFIYLLMQPELRPTFTCKTSVAAAPLVVSPQRDRRLSSIYVCRALTNSFARPRRFALNRLDVI